MPDGDHKRHKLLSTVSRSILCSAPLMFAIGSGPALATGASHSPGHAYADSEVLVVAQAEGEARGEARGEAEGEARGEAEGEAKGEAEGEARGEGEAKGEAEGRR